jgi:replicative DNA helicase
MQDQPDPIADPSPEIQTTPHNREAEESLLGAILIDPEIFNEVVQFITGDDFYIHRNRWVWNAIAHLVENRIPVDILNLSEYLTAREQLVELGGAAYLTLLSARVPSALNAVSYAHIVEEYAVRRRLMSAANDVAKLAMDLDKPLKEVIDDAEKGIFAISERQGQQDTRPIKAVIQDYFDYVAGLALQSDEFAGVPTGLADLDSLLGGLQKSDLLIVAGRPGMGKTGFLIGAAKTAAMKYHKHVAIFSLEMSKEQLAQRFLTQYTKIESQKFRRGRLSEDEWGRLTNAMADFEQCQIFLDDTPAITPLQLRTKCRRLHMEYNLDLIIVDYLQLMTGDVRTDNRVQEVSSISRYLKVMARELNVPVLAAAQLSRAVEQRTDKRPMLSDLRESGSLEQDADIVMFIHRPDALEKSQQPSSVAEIIVAKHRNGPTHSGIQVIFYPRYALFENASTRDLP